MKPRLELLYLQKLRYPYMNQGTYIRNRSLKKGMIGSVLAKSAGIAISFLLVPLTIDIFDPVQYGIWLTISTLIIWISFIDGGLGLGFRDRYAAAATAGAPGQQRRLISTAFYSQTAISAVAAAILIPVCNRIDLCDLLNISSAYRDELTASTSILIIFICIRNAMQLITMLFLADMRADLAAYTDTAGNACALTTVLFLSRTEFHGDLTSLVVILAGMPVLVLVTVFIAGFAGHYKDMAPRLKDFNIECARKIMGKGTRFFFITVSTLLIFQLTNVIVSREMGPLEVTAYNLAFKYFNLTFMLLMMVLNPLWSAFSNAYYSGDRTWMRQTLHKCDRMIPPLLAVITLMTACADIFYKIWIGDDLKIGISTTASVAIYMSILCISNVYMYLVNGTGRITLQLAIYIIFAVPAFPLMSTACCRWGVAGMLSIPAAVYLLQGVFMRIQLHKIVEGDAEGIWEK